MDRTSMMQELASASRARDYINHFESNVSRESGYVEQLLLEENVWKLTQIEAKLQRETCAVTTKMDTVLLKTWLGEASKYQTEMNNTLVTKHRPIAPTPIQLTTDVCFPTLVVSMGRRRVAGVKWLVEVSTCTTQRCGNCAVRKEMVPSATTECFLGLAWAGVGRVGWCGLAWAAWVCVGWVARFCFYFVFHSLLLASNHRIVTPSRLKNYHTPSHVFVSDSPKGNHRHKPTTPKL
jgi:hypothetical protein